MRTHTCAQNISGEWRTGTAEGWLSRLCFPRGRRFIKSRAATVDGEHRHTHAHALPCFRPETCTHAHVRTRAPNFHTRTHTHTPTPPNHCARWRMACVCTRVEIVENPKDICGVSCACVCAKNESAPRVCESERVYVCNRNIVKVLFRDTQLTVRVSQSTVFFVFA